LEGFMNLCFYLEDLFGRHVDVTTYRSIKPHRRERTLADAVYVKLQDTAPAASNPTHRHSRCRAKKRGASPRATTIE
jgi:hypothetical protein